MHAIWNINHWYTYKINMDLNSDEHTGHHCKLVLQLQKQEDSQKCIANII